jgi:hypothetical protein
VTVCANSRGAAEDFVQEMLERVGAKLGRVVEPEFALV